MQRWGLPHSMAYPRFAATHRATHEGMESNTPGPSRIVVSALLRAATGRYRSAANSRVKSAAGTSLHPLAFWPDQRGEKSPEPWFSALARKGAMAPMAKGKAGIVVPIGPSSLITRFTIARAGRPVKRFVSAVFLAASLFSAEQCTALVVASGQSGHCHRHSAALHTRHWCLNDR
jgi:hypothetical protein